VIHHHYNTRPPFSTTSTVLTLPIFTDIPKPPFQAAISKPTIPSRHSEASMSSPVWPHVMILEQGATFRGLASSQLRNHKTTSVVWALPIIGDRSTSTCIQQQWAMQDNCCICLYLSTYLDAEEASCPEWHGNCVVL
jgi:hypothetical protein